MTTESITSLNSPLLAGSASNISSEEQSTDGEISQDARFFDERKSACISFLKRRRLVHAFLLTSLLIVVVCLATIFTLRGKPRNLLCFI